MSRPPIETSASPRFRPTRAKEFVPDALAGRPACPRFLSAPAKQRFRQLCRQLEQRRQLTKADGELLALYATLWVRWREASDDVARRGAVVISISRGKNQEIIEREKKNPYLLIAQETEKEMVAVLDRLGFTPLNREKVKKTKAAEPTEPVLPAWLIEETETEEEQNVSASEI